MKLKYNDKEDTHEHSLTKSTLSIIIQKCSVLADFPGDEAFFFILDLVDFDLALIRRTENRHVLKEAWRSGLTKFSFSLAIMN